MNPKPEIGAILGDKGLKAVAIDLFKKSQRLPPLSLLMGKRSRKTKTQSLPKPFEFADFYHL